MTRGLVFCVGLLLALPGAAADVRIVDDAGRALVFSRPPQRIVSLTPHLTELLFAVGAGGQLVGVDSASDYPDAARRLPQIGDATRIRFERILALKPDLVVVWVGGNRPVDLHALGELDVPVLHTRANRLDDVPRLLRLLGTASGHRERGEAAARDVAARLAELRARTPKGRIPVFYQVWDRPLMTVGGSHWISDALALCGARNVFDELDALAPRVSREAVLQRAPRLVLGASDANALRHSWQALPSLPATKGGAFLSVDADRLHRLTPRLIDGVADLCEAIGPYVR